MNVPQHEPAQREWVHRLLDWRRVEARSERFPAIGRTFPLALLREYEERGSVSV